MYAEKVAARYDPDSNSVSGVITPTPPPPTPHTTQKLARWYDLPQTILFSHS